MGQIVINDMSFTYKKYYEPIFEHVTLNLDTDWRLGLVGRNGRGKSTLLKLLAGDLTPDKGSIRTDRKMEIFPYQLNSEYTRTMDVIKEGIGGLRTMEERLEDVDVLQQYLDMDGYTAESRIERELNRMGLPVELLEQDYRTLSGGEKTKIMLIILFLRPDAFVLMDEPTNHLDIEGKKAVADYLAKKTGFIVVSHDRQFVDAVADHILSINKANIKLEKGNYTTYKKNMDMIDEYEARTYANLEHEVKALERRAGRSRNWAETGNEQKTNIYGRRYSRTNGNKRYMRQAKRSEENILQDIEQKKTLLLNYEKAQELVIEKSEPEKERLLTIKELSFSYGVRPLIQNLDLNVDKGDRIWIRGKNGTGKTTLLKLLTGEIADERVEREEIKIVAAGQDSLWREGFLDELYPRKKEGAERFRRLCEVFDLPEGYLTRPLETFSSGELKKVEIARALSETADLLILDEPLNYMDIYFREQLETAILTCEPTLVFVEHDEWFGERVSTKAYQLQM